MVVQSDILEYIQVDKVGRNKLSPAQVLYHTDGDKLSRLVS